MKNDNSLQSCLIPSLSGRYVNIYKPQPDVYTLPTASTTDGLFTYKQGSVCQDWRTNDHSFIKDSNGRWHCFGITKPWVPGDNGHAGEGLCFHAIAPEGSFDQTLKCHSWADMPKISVGDCGWAPAALKIDAEYIMVGSHLGKASSTDLLNWKDCGQLSIKGGDRDPFVFQWQGQYLLLRCDGNGVSLVSSKDFANWSEPQCIFKPEQESWQTESPAMIQHEGLFYLFWTLWDIADISSYGYCPRSFVYCSDSPFDFHGKPCVAEFSAHAPELIQAENGQWFVSSADYPQRGINVAPLEFKRK